MQPRNADFANYNSIQQLADLALGRGYLDVWVAASLPGFFLRVLEKDNMLYGFSLITTAAEEETGNFPGGKERWQGKKISLLKSIAVHPEFRRKGMGKQLVEDFIKCSESKHFTHVAVTAWKTPDGNIPLAIILQQTGFSVLNEIKNYWTKDSIQKAYHCPWCGPPPCACSMILFMRELK